MIVIFTLGLLTSGCSSNTEVPVETNYYLLNSQHAANSNAQKAINKTVAVEVLELPAYLHQPHLVMQLSEHQLHYARFDMWAESLQSGMSKALINDLNQNNKNIQFIDHEFLSESQSANKLVIQIDSFHPSTASKVMLSGAFWRIGDADEKIIQQHFSFELLLSEDGYTHAIAQMRGLILTMSESILLDYE